MKPLEKITTILVFSLILSSVVFAIQINEVYPKNPEWIEIYNEYNETLNLSLWNMSDNSSVDQITCYNIQNCSLIINATYFLIIGRNTNIMQITNNSIVYFYVDDSAIGNGLNDGGDVITFFNDNYFSNMNYSSSQENMSWSWNESWSLCTLTPGFQNNCTTTNQTNYTVPVNPMLVNQSINQSNYSISNVVLNVFLESPVVLGVSYDGLFEIVVDGKENCSIDDSVTIFYNITDLNGTVVKQYNFTKQVGCNVYANTGEWVPNSTGHFVLCGNIIDSSNNDTNISDNSACKNITVIDSFTTDCDMNIDMSVSNVYNLANGNIEYNIIINDSSCNGTEHAVDFTYWIEDLFGNVVKSPYNSSSSIVCSKNFDRSWTPNEFSGSEAYLIKTGITNGNCNDSDSSNNYVEKMIVVKSNKIIQSNSFIDINDYDKNVRWGDTLAVSLDVYRGDTAKYAVNAYVKGNEKASDGDTIFHANSRFTNYTLKIPIQLKSNCDGDYSDGQYELIVEGLNTNATVNVNISGVSSNCKTITVSSGGSSGGGSSSGYLPVSNSKKTNNTEGNISKTKSNIEANDDGYLYEYEMDYPKHIFIGDEIDVIVSVKIGRADNISVYSYLWDGKDVLSDGFDGYNWSNKKTANKAIIIISNDSINKEMTVTVKNRPIKKINPGNYTLVVNIDGDNVVDIVEVIGNIDLQCWQCENLTCVNATHNGKLINIKDSSNDVINLSAGEKIKINGNRFIFLSNGRFVDDCYVERNLTSNSFNGSAVGSNVVGNKKEDALAIMWTGFYSWFTSLFEKK